VVVAYNEALKNERIKEKIPNVEKGQVKLSKSDRTLEVTNSELQSGSDGLIKKRIAANHPSNQRSKMLTDFPVTNRKTHSRR
jgi:hypothetical protein